MGGGARAFPSTRWSILHAAQDPESPAHREAIEHLCGLYWKPVYAYIRAVRHPTNEEAKDLTQDFFAELMIGGMLSRYRPDRGGFRRYLQGAIKLFLLEAHEKATALKRGGGRKILNLDDTDFHSMEGAGESKTQTPEDLFDLQWANSVLHHALQDLRDELVRTEKEVYYRVFDRYELNRPMDQPATYAPIAEEFGLKETDVANYLKFCRKRLRALILERIRDYVAGESELNSELAGILRLLTSKAR